MRSFYRFLLSAILVNFAAVTVSSGATINLIDENTIRLDGIIEIGDFEKIKPYLSEKKFCNDEYCDNGRQLTLSSLGGSLDEGLKIAKMVEETHIHSFIDNGDRCESACAVIFLASRSRRIHQNGYLGLHSPSLNNQNGEDISKIFFNGTEVVSLFNDQVRRFSELLNLKYFPKSAALIWASTPSTEMYYVEKLQEISEMNIDVEFHKNPLIYFDVIQSARNVCHNTIIKERHSSEVTSLNFEQVRQSVDVWQSSLVVEFLGRIGVDYMDVKCSVDFGDNSIRLYFPQDESSDEPWVSTYKFAPEDQLNWSFNKRDTKICEIEVVCQSKREKQIKDILHNTADVRSEQNQPTSCFVGKDFFLSQVINVESYTNLRSAPDLKAKIIARVPLGTSVRFTDPSVSYVTGPCKTICQTNTDIPKIQECIENNQVWMEVAYENKKGFLSRKFLE